MRGDKPDLPVRSAGSREKILRILGHRAVPALVALGLCGATLLVTFLLGESYFERRPIRLVFDNIDLAVYFREGEWTLTPGHLPFRDTFSEYPLAANLIFGMVRLLSDQLAPFTDPFKSFSWWWMGLAAFGYGFAAARLANQGWLPLAIWLSPAVAYFSLFRFDLYPALACMMALWALREERLARAALWLGLCIALKGYAAVTLPAFAVFVIARAGFRKAVGFSALAAAPMLVSLAAVWIYAGLDGVLMPFRFHAGRTFNDETIYVAVDTLLKGRAAGLLDQLLEARVPLALQAGFSLLAAALRPRTFEQLVHAFLVAIVGFILASVFHSPQFVLWIVAVAVFTSSRYTLGVTLALGWLTFLYFPVLFDWEVHPERPRHIRGAFELGILAMVLLQLMLMIRPGFASLDRREPSEP